jgi:molecular chaperone GrpE (heat shock protein)
MSEERKPTFEERLQALAESLELLYRDHQQVAADIAALQRSQQQDAANIHSLTLIARDCLDSIKRLERVATAHQDRLDNHEQRIDDLER